MKSNPELCITLLDFTPNSLVIGFLIGITVCFVAIPLAIKIKDWSNRK